MFEDLFKAVKQNCVLDDVSGGLVPLATCHDGGAHLFINCVLPIDSANRLPSELLEWCRFNACKIAELVNSHASGIEFKNLCISFYNIPTPGENIRVYRTAIKKDNLNSAATSKFGDINDGEESSLSEIRLLISKL